MTGQTYLLRSRHGVYYLRMVIPQAVRHALGVPQREVRISLRTKDKQHARLELASRVSAMTKTFKVYLQSDTPWEREAETEREERRQRYRHGAELIAKYGEFDIDDEDQLDVLRDALGPDEFEDYIFVRELQRQKNQTPSGLRANSTKVHQPVNQLLDRQAQRQGDLQDEKLRVAIDRFATHRRRTANQATVDKYVSQCEFFLKIVAEGQAREPMLSDITVAHVQNYIDVLTKLPKKLSPKDTRSIATLIATDAERMSDRTKSAHAQAVNMFLSWCSEQLYDVQPNLNRILAPLLGKAKRSNLRKYFTDEELARFFSLEIFQTGNYKRASDYWVPILGLYTGAREAELCQLLVSDVRRDPTTSIWYLDINDEGDKRLKTESSRRQVPLHPELERMNFLEFVEGAKGNQESKLFPSEVRNPRGEFGAFSKRFNRYKKEKAGIKSEKGASILDFHSFRHVVQEKLFNLGCEEFIINELVGHSKAKHSEGLRTYATGASLEVKRQTLIRPVYNVKLNPIAKP
jgi:integrase